MNAEAHLRNEVGSLVSQMLFQIAVLKAEIDTLKEAAGARDGTEPGGGRPVPTGARPGVSE